MPALTSEIFGLQHFASNYCLVQARALPWPPRVMEKTGDGAEHRCPALGMPSCGSHLKQ